MSKIFIYILTNPAFPGLVKIGYSRQIPDARAEELYTTGVPTPFELDYYCIAEGGEALEAAIHQALSQHRHRSDREFFRASVPFARAVIEQCCTPEAYCIRDIHKNVRMAARMRCPRCTTVYQDQLICPACQVILVPG